MPNPDRYDQIEKLSQQKLDTESTLSPSEYIGAIRSASSIPGRTTSFSDWSQYQGRAITENDQSLGSTFQSDDEDK